MKGPKQTPYSRHPIALGGFFVFIRPFHLSQSSRIKCGILVHYGQKLQITRWFLRFLKSSRRCWLTLIYLYLFSPYCLCASLLVVFCQQSVDFGGF